MTQHPELNDMLLHVGEKLYNIRHARNETLTTVAKSVGVSHSLISLVENGRYRPIQLTLLSRLASHYQTHLSVLLHQPTA